MAAAGPVMTTMADNQIRRVRGVLVVETFDGRIGSLDVDIEIDASQASRSWFTHNVDYRDEDGFGPLDSSKPVKVDANRFTMKIAGEGLAQKGRPFFRLRLPL